MRLVLLLVAIVALGGCATVDQDVAHLQQEQDAISAATKKIKVVLAPTSRVTRSTPRSDVPRATASTGRMRQAARSSMATDLEPPRIASMATRSMRS